MERDEGGGQRGWKMQLCLDPSEEEERRERRKSGESTL